MNALRDASAPGGARGEAKDLLGGKVATDDNSTDILSAALELAEGGFEVFPLRGKLPLKGSHGVLDATRDPEVIVAEFAGRNFNIGVRVPDGILVVDVDPRHGGERNLDSLQLQHAPLPETLTAVSGRLDGGTHKYFTHRGRVSESGLRRALKITGKDSTGIDLRGRGNYLVAPPSVHPATGARYYWADRSVPPAPLPEWLAKILTPPKIDPFSGPVSIASDKRIAKLLQIVAAEPDGNRNKTLHWAACRAAEAGVLQERAAEFVAAAVSAGLGERPSVSTVNSAANLYELGVIV